MQDKNVQIHTLTYRFMIGESFDQAINEEQAMSVESLDKKKPVFKIWDKNQPLYLRLWGLLIFLIGISTMFPD